MWGAPLPRTLPDEVLLIKEDGTGELLKVVEYYEKSLKPPLEENGKPINCSQEFLLILAFD